MIRRRFVFWIGLLLFWIGEKTRASSFDSAAASLMARTEPDAKKGATNQEASTEKWEHNENATWRWFERRTLVDGKWKLTGVTTPVHKTTGELYKGKQKGYLNEDVVPESVQRASRSLRSKLAKAKIDPERRARDGRPPSEWLRSLNADEIRVWLRTIKVPEFGVDGMTFFTHLTRDHSFTAERIEDLTVAEQAKLHAAAHHGY